MQNIFLDTRKNDQAVREKYGLTEDIMMEDAASAVCQAVLRRLSQDSSPCLARPAVLVLAGSGNNGADGYAVARQLMSSDFAVVACAVGEANSSLCKEQKSRAEKIGVRIIAPEELDAYMEESSIDLKVIVDCIYGSGFRGSLPAVARAVILSVNNNTDAYKIACDLPTGLDQWGRCGSVFHADETITMGALKIALFSDKAKDECGVVSVCPLGISRDNFERAGLGEAVPNAYLLEEKDMELPYRKKQNVNKGSFGHVAVCSGQKIGASVLAGQAAFAFGAGLVTLVSEAEDFPSFPLPYSLMSSHSLPAATKTLALGMGLGRRSLDSQAYTSYLLQNPSVTAVLDADVFYNEDILRLLSHRPEGLLLTPHPKEFLSLLSLCDMDSLNGVKLSKPSDVVDMRLELVSSFCRKYPGVVLLLKGANSVIASCPMGQDKVEIFINATGTAALAKAGSGDVLSGLAAALLAQGYEPLKAAITASLAHSAAAKSACRDKSEWSLGPEDLIRAVGSL
ncbi:MAG: NAD(P)H-hydrate dehydratase [Treponema sp.]|nr:NAD(P)H-hydrate dehydratase [Treponema sp.]